MVARCETTANCDPGEDCKTFRRDLGGWMAAAGWALDYPCYSDREHAEQQYDAEQAREGAGPAPSSPLELACRPTLSLGSSCRPPRLGESNLMCVTLVVSNLHWSPARSNLALERSDLKRATADLLW